MRSIQDFQTEMERAGLVVETIVADGTLHRCATLDKPHSKNGWYVFYGDGPAAGAFGDWRTGASYKFTSGGGNGLTAADHAILKKRLQEAQLARREEEAKRHELASSRARKILERCKPARADHPYLIQKSVKPTGDLKAMKGLLVIPVTDETGAVTSLQFISADGTKRFLTGGKIHGGFFPITGADGPLYICEGYATGATVHEATGGTVFCAFNAGNLLAVASMARRKYPNCEIVIAADNDRETPGNPGLSKAKQAGGAIGAAVAYPEFPTGATGTDFNDLRTACGLDAVKERLTVKPQTTGDLFTDLENAAQFAEKHQGKIRYCHKFNRWLVWSGQRWEMDFSGGLWRLAREYVLSLLDAARTIQDDKQRAFFLKEMAKLQNEKKLTAMVSLARHLDRIPIAPEALDKNLMLFNARDVTVDLRTFEYLPHDPGNFITKLSPFAIDGDESCPKWKEHLNLIMGGNQALIEFVQRALGSCLAGENRDRKLFLLWGSGANGKSLTLEAIQMILGDYGMKTPAETLLVKRFESIPNDLARLNGARFVYTSEVSDGKKMAESLVKELTGDKFITARFMRGEWFEFPVTFKIFLATNHLPTVRGTDPAIWDRIMLIPFNVRIPEDQRRAREDLMGEFRAEGAGILKWLLYGCHDWLVGGLNPPPQVLAANLTYREQSDFLKAFIDDACTVSEKAWVRSADIYKVYEKWAKENGEDPVKKVTFGRRLREKGFKDFRTSSGVRGWRGVGLQDEEQRGFDTF